MAEKSPDGNREFAAARVRLGLLQRDLAERCGISQADVSRIEANGWIPPEEIRNSLAEALGASPETLFGALNQIAS